MNALRLTVLLALSLAEGFGVATLLATRAGAQEREHNTWPVRVEHFDASGRIEAWEATLSFGYKRPAHGTERDIMSSFHRF